jgi:hypothetical protein
MHDGKRITMTLDQIGVSDNAPDWVKQEWRVTLRNGRKRMTFPYYGGGAASDPSADDVVESLTVDAYALSTDFAEWCYEFDYDVDSRQAHKTYNACRNLAKRFARMMGE